MTEAATAPVAAAPTLEQVAAEVFGSDPVPTDVPVVEAAPAVEPETPAEPEAKVAEKDDRVGARIAAAKRAEQKASREREELRSQRETQEKRAAELEAREAEIRLLEEDPTKFFEVRKMGPKAIAEHLEKLAGTYKPEAIEAKKLSTVEEKLAALEAEIKRRDDAERQRTFSEKQTKAEQEAGAAFVQHISTGADRYPNLTQEFTESEAVSLAFSELTRVIGRDASGKPVTRVQAYIAEHGQPPDDEVIAEHLDAIAKARIEARSKSGWRKPGESAESASQATTTNGQQQAVPPVRGTSPRTLTSREASTRASAPKPWSQEAADAESIRILEAAARKTG